MSAGAVRLAASIAAAWLACGCASILNGTHDELRIESLPVDARFEIHDDGGTVLTSGRTPARVRLPRKRGYLSPARYTVQCSKDAFLPSSTAIRSRMSGWAIVDMIGLSVLMLAIDPVTGGMWELEDPPAIQLQPDVPLLPQRQGSDE